MSAPNQFAATFLQEAGEQLALIEDITLQVENHPDDREAVNRLFRIFHTIKGSGSMFGFEQVAAFTHHVETLLDQVRSGQLAVSRPLVDAILASKDQIHALLQGAPDAEFGSAALVARLNDLRPRSTTPAPTAPTAPTPAPPSPAPAATSSFHIRFRPDPGILGRGIDPADLLADLGALGPAQIRAEVGAVPPLDQLAPESCLLAWDIQLTTGQGVNAIKDVFIFVEDDSEIRIDPVSPATTVVMAETRSRPTPALPQSPEAPHAPANVAAGHTPAAPAKRGAPARQPATADGSVRVPAERLNRLVNLVGELVIHQSRLAQISGRLDSTDLSSSAEDLERLVGELRDIVLGIRMMPIGSTFSRFKRLVRDLSAELGKEIDLVTEGEETELDKTVIDQLGDPLVHLIRNSIDHGISTPEERAREGKPARGTIRLAARHEGANVLITIEDDGRGLDKDAIRAKAIEKNLLAPDASLTDSELFNLVFLPGFSTARKVTNVSGRGVGMDVVKRQIDALRGSVEITSQPQQGSCVALTLPLTLAIIDGLLVEIHHEQFIIPMSCVRENVELTAAQRGTGNGRNVLAVRGELIPYLRLREIFGIDAGEQDLERVVIVTLGNSRMGLVVDRVVGSRQTVIQSLGRLYEDIEPFSGATIMGDGRVALILDIPGLVRFHERTGTGQDAAAMAAA